jgi:hypothetical protein
MPRLLPLLILISLLMSAPAGSAQIEGVEFPEVRAFAATDLELAGVGLLRYRVFIKGYVAGLYLAEGVEVEEVLEDVPRRLEIEYFWSIPAEGFAQATREGMSRNLDPATLGRLRGHIDQLNALYASVEPGDRYSLTYIPGQGTELALNGVPRGRIEGAEFSSALFAIWLGDEPLDRSLRDQLLGSL